MGTINYGMQEVSVQYLAGADAKVVNKRLKDIHALGIYIGGYLTKISDAVASVSPLVCELGDGTHQVRVETTADQNISVGPSTPYVILRWGYVASNINYMDMLAVASGSIQPDDLVVGRCVYAGPTLTSFDYAGRHEPETADIRLRVEALQTPAMRVRIRAGRVNYGVANIEVINQESGIFTAPVSNPRIDVMYIDTDGLVKVYTGTEAVSPVAPVYNSKKVLAEITLTVGMTQITTDDIQDVRSMI